MIVEWMGGPHDGEVMEVEGNGARINLIEQLDLTPVDLTSEPSPIGPAHRQISVPIVRWSDGSLRALWEQRTPR